MALSENTKAIFKTVKESVNAPLTVAEIAEAVGVSTRSAQGSVLALSRQNLVNLVEVEKGEETVKVVAMTEAGLSFDIDAVVEKPKKSKKSAETDAE